jgi:hypothetical protein
MSQPKAAPATTTQIQETKLPAWVDAGGQENYDLAKQVASQPYVGYTGERVAPLSAGEQAAGGILASGMAPTAANLGIATGAATGAASFKPQQITAPTGVANVNAPSFLSGDVSKYMDPNINNVVNTTMTGMQQNLDRSAQGLSDSARGAGAWGGSRFGVEDAVLKAQGAQGMASTEAGLRSAAYTDAAGRMQTDNATALQAALANQNSALTTQGQGLTAATSNQAAGIAGANVNIAGGQLANQNASTSTDTATKTALASSTLGANNRSVAQAQDDANYQSFLAQQNYPTDQLNLRLAALGMTPYGKTTSTTGTSTTPTSSNGLLTGLGAAATVLPMLFSSDRKVKKEIKKVGKLPNDVGVYKYKYKDGFNGGASDGVPQIGFMADDVKKKVPGAVVKQNVGGKVIDTVNYAHAATAPRKPRTDKGEMRGKYKPRIGGSVPFMARA